MSAWAFLGILALAIGAVFAITCVINLAFDRRLWR